MDDNQEKDKKTTESTMEDNQEKDFIYLDAKLLLRRYSSRASVSENQTQLKIDTVSGAMTVVRYTNAETECNPPPLFTICYGENPMIIVKYKGLEKKFSPEDILSLTLSKMKEDAQVLSHESVKKGVLAVPACVSDTQILALEHAGTIAGLEELKVFDLEEFVYRSDIGEKTVLFFNFGDETLDLTLYVKGNPMHFGLSVGGEDITNNLVDHFLHEFSRKHKKKIRGDSKALRRLTNACERLKRTLSSQVQASIELDSLYEGIDFYSIITRERLVELNLEMFNQWLEAVDHLLVEAGIHKAEVDDVVLLGGSSRIPEVQKILQDFFYCATLSKNFNAVTDGAKDYVVVLNDPDLVFEEFPVTPISLGMETAGSLMKVFIPRNTTYPIAIEQIISTFYENQETFLVQVYAGERPLTMDNIHVGTFELRGIPPAPRAVPRIKVVFSIDATGLLEVSAEETTTGVKNNFTYSFEEGILSEEQIETLIKEAERYKAEDEAMKKKAEARVAFENYAYSMRDRARNEKLDHSDKLKIENCVDVTIEWLDVNQHAEVEEFEHKLKELENFCNPGKVHMGICLSSPKTEKASEDGENDRLRYGLSSMQRWHSTMEDAGAKSDFHGPTAGSTACVAIIHSNQLVVANAGDSRCVLSRKGQAYDMSKDHKPYLDAEKERIINAGGYVQCGRVNGDMELKQSKSLPAEKQIVTANSDIRT